MCQVGFKPADQSSRAARRCSCLVWVFFALTLPRRSSFSGSVKFPLRHELPVDPATDRHRCWSAPMTSHSRGSTLGLSNLAVDVALSVPATLVITSCGCGSMPLPCPALCSREIELVARAVAGQQFANRPVAQPTAAAKQSQGESGGTIGGSDDAINHQQHTFISCLDQGLVALATFDKRSSACWRRSSLRILMKTHC